jgi:hypothetical protein
MDSEDIHKNLEFVDWNLIRLPKVFLRKIYYW